MGYQLHDAERFNHGEMGTSCKYFCRKGLYPSTSGRCVASATALARNHLPEVDEYHDWRILPLPPAYTLVLALNLVLVLFISQELLPPNQGPEELFLFLIVFLLLKKATSQSDLATFHFSFGTSL